MRSLARVFAMVCALGAAGIIGYQVALLQNGVLRDTQQSHPGRSEIDLIRTAVKHGHIWKDSLAVDELKINITNNQPEKTLKSEPNISNSSLSDQSQLPGLPDEPKHPDISMVFKIPNITNPVASNAEASVGNTRPAAKVTDPLHDLYRRLLQNPDQVIADEMMAQKFLYVRIPKCGSRTFYNPLSTVAKRNFPKLTLTKMPDDITYTSVAGEDTRELFVVNLLNESPVPYMSAGGHRYLNYRRYGHQQPISFSLFRDPVERFISNFYFVRNGDKQVKNAQLTFGLGETAMNTTLEECAAALDKMRQQKDHRKMEVWRICGCDYSSFTHMLCGETKSCNVDDNSTLSKALNHMDDFLLIGFTDELETSVRMMERLMPFYLRGYTDKFKSLLGRISQASRTKSKQQPSTEVVAQLRRVMEREYVLYDEARKRFEKLKKELGMT